MFNLNQWITWEPVQFPGEPKPRKIPCGGNSAHDPNNWVSYEIIRSITQNFGFVFTENDPYFFLDIENYRMKLDSLFHYKAEPNIFYCL